MAYEYDAEVKIVGGSLNRIAVMLTDEVPDQAQIAQLTLEAANAIVGAIAPLSAEQKKEFKAKFLTKVGIFVASNQVEKLGLEEKDKETVRILLNALSRVLDVQLPDEPNA